MLETVGGLLMAGAVVVVFLFSCVILGVILGIRIVFIAIDKLRDWLNRRIWHERDKLKSCPFCGSEAKLYEGARLCRVYCSKCGISTEMFRNLGKCVETWNRRIYDERN